MKTEITEQSRLLLSLSLLRRLLDEPTTLAGKTYRAAQAVARDIGDRCWMNVGWHAANPDRELKGTASTAKIFEDMKPLIDLLQARVRPPKRSRGRPSVDAISGPDFLIIAEHLQDKTGRSLPNLIDECIRERGYPLDEKKTTASHAKRIERIIAKLQKAHAPKTNNILQFPSNKKPRRKMDWQ